jgi:hypothetical protein
MKKDTHQSSYYNSCHSMKNDTHTPSSKAMICQLITLMSNGTKEMSFPIRKFWKVKFTI